jgi:hypothetical protein
MTVFFKLLGLFILFLVDWRIGLGVLLIAGSSLSIGIQQALVKVGVALSKKADKTS